MKASLSLNGYMLIDDKKATAEQVNAIIAERDAALAREAELVAQVGRAGFVAGYGRCWRESYGTKPNTDSVDEYADSYAERVKAGEL